MLLKERAVLTRASTAGKQRPRWPSLEAQVGCHCSALEAPVIGRASARLSDFPAAPIALADLSAGMIGVDRSALGDDVLDRADGD